MLKPFLPALYVCGFFVLSACATITENSSNAPAKGFSVKAFTFANTAFVRAYAIETDTEILVVDAGFSPAHADDIKAYADERSKPISKVFLTHGHIDHYAGAYSLVRSNKQLITSAGVAEQIRNYDAINYARFRAAPPAGHRIPEKILKDGETIQIDGVTITLIDAGPGESYSDAWFEFSDGRNKALFVGDTIMLGIPPFMQSGHSGSWLESLDRLRSIAGDEVALYVGHDTAQRQAVYGRSAIDTQTAQITVFHDTVRSITDGRRLLTKTEIEEVLRTMESAFPQNNQNFNFLITTSANILAAEIMLEKQREEFESSIQAMFVR